MINGHLFQSLGSIPGKFAALAALGLGLMANQSAMAQFGLGFGRIGVVGGVSVDADGTVRNASAVDRSGSLRDLRELVQEPKDQLRNSVELRMVSLKKLQAEINKSIENNQPLAQDVMFLAGLQRVEYVFVYPEQQDIVLAGPAEGWVVREDAAVVGETTGRPVLQLEDLIVALRTTEAAQQRAISVSIDPTAAGSQRLQQLLSQLAPGVDPRNYESTLREAFGPQTVTLTTVPKDSRMARTLVSADYRMKRLAMALDASPRSLPSYLDMVKNTGSQRGVHPRWWMACDYDAILHSEDMLAWKLTGKGIKAMTEDEVVDVNGGRKASGKVSKQAQRWADLFTEQFTELSKSNVAFGDLRNVMDLNIVATVIRGHGLEEIAGCNLALLRGAQEGLDTPSWTTPAAIAPECSFVRGAVGWTVAASGGVEINSWKVVSQKAKLDETVKSAYSKAKPVTANSQSRDWWWN